MKPSWTTPSDVRAQLLKNWRRGQAIGAYAEGEVFQPVRKLLKTPTATDILHQPEAVERWVAAVHKDALPGIVQIQSKPVDGRRHGIGTSTIPAAVLIDSFDALCRFLGTTIEVTSFDEVRAITERTLPQLVPWVKRNPLKVIDNRASWDHLLGVVDWLARNDPSERLLRQLDVDGVDTKFVEQHRSILNDLLTAVLPPDRIDDSIPVSQFGARFRFRTKPSYVRLRFLDPGLHLIPGCSELTIRVDELPELATQFVFVVENEASYLSFPDAANAIVVFGSGFAVTQLQHVTWLRNQSLIYWGDIDTWGFQILDNLRRAHGDVESLLMDEATLLRHRQHWSQEGRPGRTGLPSLTAEEAALYQALVDDAFGPAVRLEQERIRFSAVQEAVDQLITRHRDRESSQCRSTLS